MTEDIKDIIIQRLLKHNNYLNEYITYLLGGYSEEEFNTICENFAIQNFNTTLKESLSNGIFKIKLKELNKYCKEHGINYK
jgi:hypothetical protein